MNKFVRAEIHCPYCGISLERSRVVPVIRWVFKGKHRGIEPEVSKESERALRVLELECISQHNCTVIPSEKARSFYERVS